MNAPPPAPLDPAGLPGPGGLPLAAPSPLPGAAAPAPLPAPAPGAPALPAALAPPQPRKPKRPGHAYVHKGTEYWAALHRSTRHLERWPRRWHSAQMALGLAGMVAAWFLATSLGLPGWLALVPAAAFFVDFSSWVYLKPMPYLDLETQACILQFARLLRLAANERELRFTKRGRTLFRYKWDDFDSWWACDDFFICIGATNLIVLRASLRREHYDALLNMAATYVGKAKYRGAI